MDLQCLIKKYPVGQLRTGVSKPFVFLGQTHVIKGPYKNLDTLKLILERSRILLLWSTPCVVKVTDWILIDEQYYLLFPNLYGDYYQRYEAELIKVKEKSGLKYKVLKGESCLIDLGVYLKSNELNVDLTDYLVGLCHLYILSVGDMNLRNSLYHREENKIYLIDFDCNRADDGINRPDFYFNKKAGDNLKWYEKAKPYYSKVAKRIKNLLNSKIAEELALLDRIKMTIDLLKKYGRENTIPGKMTLQGPNRSLGYSGYSIGILKSGLQKYIRRGETEKALICGFELFYFSNYSLPGIVTMLYNRLGVIACEDIGLANLGLVLETLKVVLSKDRDPQTLAMLIINLSQSLKTRFCSWVNRAYGTKEGREIMISKGQLKLKKPKNPPQLEDILDSEDDPKYRKYLRCFNADLSKKNRRVIYWLYKFWSLTLDDEMKNKVKSRSRLGLSTKSKDPMILIWEVLSNYLSKEILDPLLLAYFDSKKRLSVTIKKKGLPRDSFVYLILAIVTYTEDWNNKTKIIIPEISEYKTYLKCQHKPIKIDEYVIDKHTIEGIRKGKNIHDFVTEGAKIIPEDEKYSEPLLLEIYSKRD